MPKPIIIRSLAFVLALSCVASTADARTMIRRQAPYDNVSFHGNYGGDPFDPAADFTLEIWNCANGTMPTFIADRESLIVCGYDPTNGYTLGDRVYAVDVPGGTCVDHGRSCYYRTRDVPSVTPGLRFFRVQYARAARGNRVWLDSYGSVSSADSPNMLILIEIDDHPRAIRTDTFIAIANGGWFSP